MSYGTSYITTFPRVPVYVDRILKGAKPAETAIEVFAKHQLVINRKNGRRTRLDHSSRAAETRRPHH